MDKRNQDALGPLQARVMMLLRDRPLCGKDLMNVLRIRSPGTIYPLLAELRSRQLVGCRTETAGAIRRKRYFLTEKGAKHVRERLLASTRMFCCDPSLHMKKILEYVKEITSIRPHQKILCTLEFDEVKQFLRGADATFSSELDVPYNAYDIALSFLGVGCLIGKEEGSIARYVNRLYKSLKSGGSLVAIEIEKSDNIFAEIFFRDMLRLDDSPGQYREDLERILSDAGFKETKVVAKSGLLYAHSRKD